MPVFWQESEFVRKVNPLAENDSARKAMGEPALRVIAHELDFTDPERCQGVQDRIGDRRKCADHARLAATFHAKRIGRAARRIKAELEGYEVVGTAARNP